MRKLVLAVSAAMLVSPAAGAAQRSDEEWLRDCRERERGELVRFCEVRVERVQPGGGAIRVDPGANGGVAVEGWDRNEIEVHARIEARAEPEAAARGLAEAVRVITVGPIGAEGPAREGRASWHVSFVVFAPVSSDLELTTRNGPLAVRNVNGRMRLEAVNGPLSLRDVGGDVQARTQNGPISVALSGTRWEGAGLDAETRNGPVSLALPEGYNARLETGTVHGPFTSDVPLEVTLRGRMGGPVTATLGSGGPPIRVVTTNGPVSISRR